jgi:hypothetical protein
VEINQPGPIATSFDDSGLSASTVYFYRVRVETGAGFSAYSNEATATTPAPLPSPPTLQAAPLSASQIRLTWITTATGIVRFHIERRIAAGSYAEINQPGPTATSFDDSGLSALTAYFYRIRVETAAGLSPYSNEVTATTLQGLPAAPTNLQATATSSTQANLTWTNNAPDATAIRLELQTPNTAFTDIGPAPTLTGTLVTNLQPSTAYAFRVRAQNAVGFSPYSNSATVTTPSIPKTIYLIPGIGQTSDDMQSLYGSLTAAGSLGIDPNRFRVDPGFYYRGCAEVDFCPSNCSISGGAQALAQYILNRKPPGDIVLIGFSMGGLIARDMIATNWFGVLNGRKMAALITLGTPSAGYPYTFIDRTFDCTPLITEMDGNWRSQQAQNSVVLSDYLRSLTSQWTSYPGNSGVWFAASGRSCSNPIRIVDPTTGCRDSNPYSDGVVCDDSATYNLGVAAATKPTSYWRDAGQMYVHSSGGLGGVGSSLILCGNVGGINNPPLSAPPAWDSLFATIRAVINGL